MKKLTCIFAAALLAGVSLQTSAQVSRKTDNRKSNETAAGVTQRMRDFYEKPEVSDASKMWERIIYRQLDLTQNENLALYYPDEPVDGQESLFRIILRVVCNGQVPAYEYLDGREVFTDQYKIKVGEMLDRFHIMYTTGRGSTEKNPRYVIDESDVPSNEVLSYYAIERYEFNSLENRVNKQIQAICPVLHRVDDYGGEPIKYPMFWVKLDQLRPYLAQQSIFVDDDNNLAKYNYDDYFQLGMYKGDIYKTRNLRNQSLMQMFPDPDDLKHAQDSIENRLRAFDRNLWVPTREELAERQEAEEAARLKAEGKSDDVVVKDRDGNDETEQAEEVTTKTSKNKRSVRQTKSSSKSKSSAKKTDEKKKTTTKKKKTSSSSKSSSSGAVRSVRRTK